MTLDEFFAGYDDSRPIFEALRAVVEAAGPADIRVTKSQVAFTLRTAYAWAWIPDRYLRGGHAPLVLSVALRRRDGSPRWKEVVEPRPGRFMHHLELYSVNEVDDEVSDWLAEARAAAD